MKRYVNLVLCFAVFIGYSFKQDNEYGKPIAGINYRILGLGQTLETGVSCFTDTVRLFKPSIYYTIDFYNFFGGELYQDDYRNDKRYSNNKFGLIVTYDLIQKKVIGGFYLGYRNLTKEKNKGESQ